MKNKKLTGVMQKKLRTYLDESPFTKIALASVFFFFGFVVAFLRFLNDSPKLIFVLFALLAWMASSLIFGSKELSSIDSTLLKGSIIFVPAIAGIVTATLVLSGLATFNQKTAPSESPPVVEQVAPEESFTVDSHFYELEKNYVDTGLNTPWVVAISDDEAIAVTADGAPFDSEQGWWGTKLSKHEVHLVSIHNSNSSKLGTISLHELVAINAESVGEIAHRTLDILPVSTSRSSKIDLLFVSFATNDFIRDCRTLNVAKYTLPVLDQGGADRELLGDLYFQSECFPVTGDPKLNQSGGRLVSVPNQMRKSSLGIELFLSVGDFIKLSANSDELTPLMKSQLSSVLHLTEGSQESLVSGLRNPQGMAVIKMEGGQLEILTSEHGPRGGDELNLIRKGSDYGWPNSSYGTAYVPNNPGAKPEREGDSGGFTLPLFSWIPSIAPSQVLQVQPGEFYEWWSVKTNENQYGDVLVSSLGGESIFRLRIEQGAVRYVERIFVGQRIRTFSQTPGGKLVIGTDSGQLLVIGKSKEWSSSAGELVPVQ
jgi:glucose/arabinose dehydrogenase